jgi:hypothetical protein
MSCSGEWARTANSSWTRVQARRSAWHPGLAGSGARHDQVLQHVEIREEALGLAVLGQQEDAFAQGRGGTVQRDRAAVELDLSAAPPEDAEEHAHQLRAP